MIEVPTDRELSERYDDELAETLLEIADAARKITANDFAGQLWNWASMNAEILRDTLDYETNPNIDRVRKELNNLSTQAEGLVVSLSRLTLEARVELERNLEGDTKATNYDLLIKSEEMIRQNLIQTDFVRRAAKGAANDCDGTSIKDGPKNRITAVRKQAVRELGVAWKMLTGERPARKIHGRDHPDTGQNYGPFEPFAVAALSPLFGEALAQSGIDDAIKQVAADMGKRPNDYWSRFFHI